MLFLGQYSTGKTTFIEYLLERQFPGEHIGMSVVSDLFQSRFSCISANVQFVFSGPEPTTDRFCAIMHGEEDRVIPGNALAVQADQPYRGLQKFGTAFLNRFQVGAKNTKKKFF